MVICEKLSFLATHTSWIITIRKARIAHGARQSVVFSRGPPRCLRLQRSYSTPSRCYPQFAQRRDHSVRTRGKSETTRFHCVCVLICVLAVGSSRFGPLWHAPSLCCGHG